MRTHHPIWQTFHWAVILLLVGSVLKWNATNFDWTEIKSIVEIGFALAGIFGGQTFIAERNRKKREAAKSSEASWYE